MKPNCLKLMLPALAAVILTNGFCEAQVGLQPRAIYVDFATFASDSAGYSAFHIYYQIYTSQLLYARQRGNFIARYSVSAVIKKGKKQVTSSEVDGLLKEESYEKTIGQRDFVINGFSYLLPPGRYQVTITLRDLNADNSVPLTAEITIPEYRTKSPQFSSLLFARQIISETEIAGQDSLSSRFIPAIFAIDTLRVLPSCSRIFGDENNLLRVYAEYYDPNTAADSIRFAYEIKDMKGNLVYQQTSVSPWAVGRPLIKEIELEHFKPGPYELILNAVDSKDRKLASVGGRFRVSWSALALVKNDFEGALEQLRYIATSTEIEALKKAPESDRIKAWNDFWKSKDPSPGTEENEIRDEYYRRIAYANEHYSLPSKEGWRTDAGMVYITYGEPDEIERHPFDIESKPYELWYYYNPRRTFLFVDINGYGEYVLQYPYDGDIQKFRNSGGR